MCFSVLMPVALLSVVSIGCVYSQSAIQLEFGCRGLLQFLSSDGDSMLDLGSGSGDFPTIMVWMNVCSKEFGHNEAEVVCRQLGCGSNVKRVHPSKFNVTSSDIIPFLVTSFPYTCSGLEDSVEECQPTHTTCKIFDDNSADIIALECAELPTTSEEELEDTASARVNCSSSVGRPVYTNTLLTTLLVVYFSC